MGRVLATALITIVHLIFALFVATVIAERIEILFTNLNDVFANI